MPDSITRSDWVARFARRAKELRPEFGLKHLNAVAFLRYASAREIEPEKDAEAWAKALPKGPKK